MSPRPGWIPPDPGGLARTRRRLENCLQSVAWLENGCAVADLCNCIFTPSNPVSPTKFDTRFRGVGGRRFLLLRGTRDFGPQVDHDLIAGARFRGQCSLLRGRADPRPLVGGTRGPRVRESVLCKNGCL